MNKHGGYLGEDKDKVVDFSVNINPLGPSPKVIETMKSALESLHRYPDINGGHACRYLEDHLGLDPHSVILGNGAIELIYLFARSMKCKRVLIIQPTFNEYERAFHLVGSQVFHFINKEKNGFDIDFKELTETLERIQPDAVILCNPNNPTGRFYQKNTIGLILEQLQRIGSCLFLDESFMDFTDREGALEFIQNHRIFILRSLTKFYAIPGLRVGYGIGHRSIIEKMNQFKEPWSLNTLALEVLPILLEDEGFIVRSKRWLKEERSLFFKNLRGVPWLTVYKSEANFYLCRTNNGTAKELRGKLLNDNIYIRICEDFKGLDDRYFRIAVRGERDNGKLMDALNNI